MHDEVPARAIWRLVLRSGRAAGAGLGVALALAALALAAGNARAAGDPIPVRDFVRQGQFESPRLSPDGRHLVVGQRIERDGADLTLIVVYELPSMKDIATVRLPIFQTPANFAWISNSRLAVAVARRIGSLEHPYLTGEVLAMDIDGGRQEYLYGYLHRQRRSIDVPPDRGLGWINHIPASHDGHLLITENLWSDGGDKRSRLLDVDSVSTARHVVAEIPREGFDFLVQNDGTPRFAFGGDDTLDLAVLRYDEAAHDWKELPRQDKANLMPLRILQGDREFIGRVALDGGPRSLVRQSIADGSRQVLASDPVGNIDLIEWPAQHRGPFAAASSIDRPHISYIDSAAPEARLHELLASKMPGSWIDFVNYTDDGSKLLFRVRSDRDPGAYYLMDRGTGQAQLLLESKPWIDARRMGERRPIKFAARDGLEIHGYLTLPQDGAAARLPLILLPHGGPVGASDDWFFDTDAQFLASRGYAVLQVNYRGSGGRGNAFEHAGYRQWGGKIIDDLIDGVRWAVAQGVADDHRICAYGGSFGAYAAMMVSIRAPELFRCAVGYAGAYDLPMLIDRDEISGKTREHNFYAKTLGDNRAELEALSPDHLADRLQLPVLLVHGTEDERTPLDQAQAMRDALIKAGHPPEWMVVEGEGHGFYTEKHRLAFYERLQAFLAKYLAR